MASKGRTAYKNEWQKEHTDRIILVVPKGQKEMIKDHAQAHGEKVNSFIKRALGETMANDQEKDMQKQEIVQIAKESGKSIKEAEDEYVENAVLDFLEKKVPGIRKLYLAEKKRQEMPPNMTPITTLK